MNLTAPLPVDAAEAIDELEEIERLKCALAARQARVIGVLTTSSPGATQRSLGGQVALARHESPSKGRRLLVLGQALSTDHPEVLGLLEAGEINERRAEDICHATRDLTPTERRLADHDIAVELAARPGLGDRDVTDLATRVTLRINAAAARRRRQRAIDDRHVAARDHGDGTTTLSARVQDWQAAAALESLEQAVDAQVAERTAELIAGDQQPEDDPRTRGQRMADQFLDRLLGRTQAVPVHLDLLIDVEVLLGDSDEPAEIPGHGPIPADIARKLVLASPEARTLVRRLFASDGHLVAMESSAAYFAGGLRNLVTVRDRRCRTPYCNAGIRHLNHVRRRADDGVTSAHNGEGACEDCNYTAEEPGWQRKVVSADLAEPHEVEITTPTGHRHRSREPAPPRARPMDELLVQFVETSPGVLTLVA